MGESKLKLMCTKNLTGYAPVTFACEAILRSHKSLLAASGSMGGEKNYPCPRLQPKSRRCSQCFAVSIPSAITFQLQLVCQQNDQLHRVTSSAVSKYSTYEGAVDFQGFHGKLPQSA